MTADVSPNAVMEIDRPMSVKLHPPKQPSCQSLVCFLVLLFISAVAVLINFELEPSDFPAIISLPSGRPPMSKSSAQSIGQGEGINTLKPILLNKNGLDEAPKATSADERAIEKGENVIQKVVASTNESCCNLQLVKNMPTALAKNGTVGSSGHTQLVQTTTILLAENKTEGGSPSHNVQPDQSNGTAVLGKIGSMQSSPDVRAPRNVSKAQPIGLRLNSSGGDAFDMLKEQISKLVASGKLVKQMDKQARTDAEGGGNVNPRAGKLMPVDASHKEVGANTQEVRTSPPTGSSSPKADPVPLVAPPQPVNPVPAPVFSSPPFEFGHGLPPPAGTLDDYMMSVEMGICVRGRQCKFTFTTRLYYTSVAFNREIMVLVEGPEAVAAEIENPVRYRNWTASFRVWTAGAYKVLIQSDCAGFLMSTSIPLVVHEPDRFAINEQPAPSLCDNDILGRWVRTPSGVYSWKITEECDPKHLRPSNWVEKLNSIGIREINFVGDSHLRVVTQHIRTLADGGFSLEHVGYHGDIFHTIGGENGTSLKLNFYWVDGIYVNGEFGCVNRGMFSGRLNQFPSNISQTADVLVSNSAAWTWAYCPQAKESYDRHFPEYVAWLKSVLGPNTKWVWRSEAPFNGRLLGCDRRTNNGMRYANNLALEWAKKEGAQFFNAWLVEGSRFQDNCGYDPHYSCPYTFFGNAKMWNPVGEAVAVDFIHFLVYRLKR